MQKCDNIKIRALVPEDVKDYWDLRLRALKDDPEAFGADYEESKDTPLQNQLNSWSHQIIRLFWEHLCLN